PTLLGAFNLLTQIPIIQTTAIGQGTALIGAFDVGCMLFDRQRGRVTRGTIDDNFQRNIQVVRAELEAAFAVLRPAAFTKIVL
ncbi:MAG TPA: phage major capsid protein, partial [Chloroflexota bacterium]|nr:phage major capsid protein [Chloroflexota bacterium]